ncbi:MAG TPA: helix-turn-helix domain-containing protein [Roseiflexaceae bacterium]|nr:helix-turn-helix domain-containing protein [Roseiflexaceae bacterium]
MASSNNTEARERVLEAAERLFAERGYTAVTLRDIAAAVGIRHASLYHHAPGGKEELFVEVTERNLRRHQAGLEQSIRQAAPEVRARLHAAADWLLSQPPMDLVRMIHSDMPAIDSEHAQRLTWLAYDTLLSPVERVLEDARARGEIAHDTPALVAGGVIGLIESLHAVPASVLEQSRVSMAHTLLDTLLHGLYPRSNSGLPAAETDF